MTDSWAGIVVGSLALAVAALLVIGHYRREWAQANGSSPLLGRDAAAALMTLAGSRGRSPVNGAVIARNTARRPR